MIEHLPALWMHCSPALLSADVNCGATPRRACACPRGGSHDHLVDLNWAEDHPEVHWLAGDRDPRVPDPEFTVVEIDPGEFAPGTWDLPG